MRNNKIVSAGNEVKLNLKGVNMKNLQTKLFVNKIAEVAKIDENVANELMEELRETKTLSTESKKKIVSTKYQSSPAEEIDARIEEEKKNVLAQSHTLEALAEIRAAKIAKFAAEEKEIVEKRLDEIEETGNDFFREENVEAIRREIRENGYIATKSNHYLWGTIC
jgi:hypothetical protein